MSSGLLSQARAFGASRRQLAALALREARVGIMAATIAAVGSALSEVGAVVLVGRQHRGLRPDPGERRPRAGQRRPLLAWALAIGILLLGLILVITAALTVLQQLGSARRMGRAS